MIIPTLRFFPTIFRLLRVASSGPLIRYFATWSGYGVPLQPANPVTFLQAEKLPAYCIGTFDQHGHLLIFEKWLHERQTLKLESPTISSLRAKSTSVAFYRTEQDGEELTLGTALSESDMLGLPQYAKIEFGNSGSPSFAEFVKCLLSFRHKYSYWPNGTLKKWTYQEKNGENGEISYDKNGKEMAKESISTRHHMQS